jgi:hypothetical protein
LSALKTGCGAGDDPPCVNCRPRARFTSLIPPKDRQELTPFPSVRLRGLWGGSISVSGGRRHERHRRLAGPAGLGEVWSHAVTDAAECGGGAEMMNVPRALLRGPDSLRQNCRTAHGEVADMGLQTGENASSAGLDARAEGTDVGGAIPLRGEQPFLRTRASSARNE